MPVDRILHLTDDTPWGALCPRGLSRRALAISHALVRVPIVRAVGRLLQRAFVRRHGHVVDVERWGLRLRLFADRNLSEKRALFTPQRLDHTEFAFIRSVLADGDVFLDVGANAGLYTYVAGQTLGAHGRVLAFEPHPALAAQCRFNAATNGLNRVEVHACALGADEGTVRFTIDERNLGRNAIDEHAGGVEVPVRRLSAVLNERGVDRVRCMKIDIEGREKDVLSELLAHAPRSRWPRYIIAESIHDPACGIGDLLQTYGYAVTLTCKMNSIFGLSASADNPGSASHAV